MTTPKRYLITSALPYANGHKHIGHLAGAYIPADIYVRYLRAQGRDVVFVCGSDEHGTAIPIQAMKEGTTPQAIIDKYHAIMKENFDDLSVSFDVYDRTSAPVHHETASEFFTYLNDRGELIVKESEQYYDEATATFLADRYIKGTCPNCGFTGAYGDQCEKCGTALSPDELINPVSTLSGNAPVKRATKHWYLPLDKYEGWLREYILEGHKDDWRASVLGQCKSWIDAGLQPRAVTRDLDWGVKVPLADAEGKVLYVWFDAPIGYISATKTWAQREGRDWKPYWQDKDTKLVHFIGKDNIVFHCIIFPLMLKLHDYIVPDNVPANEFLNLEGDKMSTSRAWKLDMQDYIDDFIRKENGGPALADCLRYYLTSIAPETKDSDFTWKGFQDAVNGELLNKFGNFLNRTLVLMHKLTGGKVPKWHADIVTERDNNLIKEIQNSKAKIETLLEEYRFRDALGEVIALSSLGNVYLQECAPWSVAKKLTEGGSAAEAAQKEIDNCLHLSLQLSANLAILINPFLPNTAKKMCHLMKVVDGMLEWKNAGSLKLLSVGYSLRAPELLFRKIEDEEVAYQVEKLKAGMEASRAAQEQQDVSRQPSAVSDAPGIGNRESAVPPVANTSDIRHQTSDIKEEIQYDDFAKIDLRIGTVTACEKVPKADKLLQLTVDMGSEVRTIVSGIAQHFSVEEMIGKQVMVVANLAPRKMRGIESQGMILTAEQPDGRLILVGPNDRTEPGSGVR
ncbi:MAG: methionine--tRNA ligase [Chitinophagaceae bacterium]|nr:MAG: methionine--tRNA ligase [Chitinophagaceae bacterium]